MTDTNVPQDISIYNHEALSKKHWLIADVQDLIDSLSIPLKRVVKEDAKYCDMIKIKMRQDPMSATSKTYDLKFLHLKMKTRVIYTDDKELQDHD